MCLDERWRNALQSKHAQLLAQFAAYLWRLYEADVVKFTAASWLSLALVHLGLPVWCLVAAPLLLLLGKLGCLAYLKAMLLGEMNHVDSQLSEPASNALVPVSDTTQTLNTGGEIEITVENDVLATVNEIVRNIWKNCVTSADGQSSSGELLKWSQDLLRSQITAVRLKQLDLRTLQPSVEVARVGFSGQWVVINAKVNLAGGSEAFALVKMLKYVRWFKLRIHDFRTSCCVQIRFRPLFWIAPAFSTFASAEVKLLDIPTFDFAVKQYSVMKIIPKVRELMQLVVRKVLPSFVGYPFRINLKLQPAQCNAILHLQPQTLRSLQTDIPSYSEDAAVATPQSCKKDSSASANDGKPSSRPLLRSKLTDSDVTDGFSDSETIDKTDGFQSLPINIRVTVQEVRLLPRYSAAFRRPRKAGGRSTRVSRLARLTVLKTVQYPVTKS